MFVPLVTTSMLSLIEPDSEILDLHRNRWANFAEIAFAKGYYDYEAEAKAPHEHFGLLPNVPYRHLTIMSWYYSRGKWTGFLK